MAYLYQRTIRFSETDAAGVVYFAKTLAICHEAYEASLIESGIDARRFFSPGTIGFPIVHAEADYFRPAFCGDRQDIQLNPTITSESGFEIQYVVSPSGSAEKPTSKALTKHLCINPVTRERQPLPQEILDWQARWA
jgi:1,4-dihydroxy-2-naphthoyl-CoA hydrolase